jgi:hypothetical protein
MFESGFMKAKVVMKSFFAHVCPFMTAALAFVGNPEVFDTLKRRNASIALPLNLVRVPYLFLLNLFRLEQAFA